MPETRIAVTGTLGFDFLMDYPGRFSDRSAVEHTQNPSMSYLVDNLDKQLGGSAGNISYNLKLLGLDPYPVSALGQDGDAYLRFFQRNNIPAHFVRVFADSPTGVYFGVFDREGKRLGAFYTGANQHTARLSVAQVKPRPDLVIIAPNLTGSMVKYAGECVASNIPYLYDPGFQTDSLTVGDLRQSLIHAQIVVGNEYEISQIERKLNLVHSQLVVQVPVLITTLGKLGSRVESGKVKIHIAAVIPKELVAPTGARDAYIAGFVAGYQRHFELSDCARMGSVAAAFCLEKSGSMTHKFSLSEFTDRFTNCFGRPIKL